MPPASPRPAVRAHRGVRVGPAQPLEQRAQIPDQLCAAHVSRARLGFERNNIQLHQILATKTTPEGDAHYPLRHDFGV